MTGREPPSRLPPFPLERAIGDLIPCATHPSVETHLRCARCGRAICPKCLEHTPAGAYCPRCARRGMGRKGSADVGALRWLAGVPVGLVIGAIGGAAIALIPFAALQVLPYLLLGFVVGEGIAAVSGRPGGLFLALEGLLCGLLGPLTGRAATTSVMAGGGTASLAASTQSLGTLGLLLVLGAALIAGVRAGSSR